jgi:hypothetical protein
MSRVGKWTPDDDWGVAVVATVGRQLRLRREAVGMRAAEFGAAVGYGEALAQAAWADFVAYASGS